MISNELNFIVKHFKLIQISINSGKSQKIVFKNCFSLAFILNVNSVMYI